MIWSGIKVDAAAAPFKIFDTTPPRRQFCAVLESASRKTWATSMGERCTHRPMKMKYTFSHYRIVVKMTIIMHRICSTLQCLIRCNKVAKAGSKRRMYACALCFSVGNNGTPWSIKSRYGQNLWVSWSLDISCILITLSTWPKQLSQWTFDSQTSSTIIEFSQSYCAFCKFIYLFIYIPIVVPSKNECESIVLCVVTCGSG